MCGGIFSTSATRRRPSKNTGSPATVRLVNEPFDADEFGRALSLVAWVREVHSLAEVTSTNDEAKRLAGHGAPEGTVVVADRQTAGRGRLGRAWWSEPGTTLTASLVVRPATRAEEWPLITLAAGVAVAEAVRDQSGVRAELKWPNDVLARGKKLGGILSEVCSGAAVIGIGLNVSCRVPEELTETATTLALESGGHGSRADLLASIVSRFSVLFGEPSSILPRYRALCSTLGRRVVVETAAGRTVRGVARDVDDRGALVVASQTGVVAVVAGDVTHLRSDRD